MKKSEVFPLVFAMILAAAPLGVVVADEREQADAYVAREFVSNTSAADWLLEPGWVWSQGRLTHLSGSGAGAARQVAMPTMTAGRSYRIGFRFAGSTKGSVTISVGGVDFPSRGAEGGWGEVFDVLDPAAFLTFTATSDFDGTLMGVRVLELGDELTDGEDWVVPYGWVQHADRFQYEAGWVLPLEKVVNIVQGRPYWISFNADLSTDAARKGTVTLGGTPAARFSGEGGANYGIEVVAGEGTLLSFTPRVPDGGGPSPGSVGRISVREITSDVSGTR